MPLGAIVGVRSGDKGGNANIGSPERRGLMTTAHGRGIRMTPVALEDHLVAEAPVCTGVYEVLDRGGDTIDIGVADARSTFGLRGVLRTWLLDHGARQGWSVRWEVAVVYLPRYHELLMDYAARAEGLPPLTAARGERLPGRLA